MWNAQKLNLKSNKLSRMVAHHAARHVIGFANLNLIKEMSKRQKLSFRNFKWGLLFNNQFSLPSQTKYILCILEYIIGIGCPLFNH